MQKENFMKRLIVDFVIPEETRKGIDALLTSIGSGSEDCYQSELESCLKYDLRMNHLTKEQYDLLYHYYCTHKLI